MDLGLQGNSYAVGGASAGLGLAIAEAIIAEGGTVIGIARRREKLEALATEYGKRFIPFPADLTDAGNVVSLVEELKRLRVTAVVFNGGGPPTGLTAELSMTQWDDAYRGTLRWKVQLLTALLPMMRQRGHGKFLFVESVSIKQPIDNLVLSNVFRAGVAGLVKTICREEGSHGITANILAPGYHATDRITTVLEKAAELQDIPLEQVKAGFLEEVPLGRLGDPTDFGRMAAFLLSDAATYLSGQTISVDGGLVRHLTG